MLYASNFQVMCINQIEWTARRYWENVFFLFGKFHRDVAFYRFYLSFCFIFESAVNSYHALSLRLTHCFHSVTYNVHKVLILSRRYSWCCYSLRSSSYSTFLFVILLAMPAMWSPGMWFQLETSRRWDCSFLYSVFVMWYSRRSFLSEQ